MAAGNGLETALGGLRAAQEALALTSGNIANVGTRGYVRRTHAQQSVVTAGNGAGVRSLAPQRAADAYLTREARVQESALARVRVLTDLHDRLQGQGGILATSSDGRDLAGRVVDLGGGLEALANAPADPVARRTVLAGIEAIGRDIGAGVDALRRLRGEMDTRIAASVERINDTLAALEQLNRQVGTQGESAGLADRREALLGSLAQEIDITPELRSDGTVAVFTTTGRILLDGKARLVRHEPVATVAPTTRFGAIAVFHPDRLDAAGTPLPGEAGEVLAGAGLRAELPPELAALPGASATSSFVSGGALSGLLEARDAVLPALDDQLGELVSMLRHVLNGAHNGSTALPPPTTLEGSRRDLSGYDPATASGTAHLAVVDRTTGDVVRLIPIALAGATPGSLASTIDAGLAGLGSATLVPGAGLRIETTQPGLGLALDEGDSGIPVQDSAGHVRTFGLAHYFGLNDLVLPEGAGGGGLRLRPDLAADASRLASARLEVDPGPPPAASLGGPGDNRGVQALAQALQTPVATPARGGLAARSVTAAGYAAGIQALAASAAAATAQEAEDRTAMSKALKDRVASISGVNMDEELGKLMLYQQAYVAAARVVAVTSELMDELSGMAR